VIIQRKAGNSTRRFRGATETSDDVGRIPASPTQAFTRSRDRREGKGASAGKEETREAFGEDFNETHERFPAFESALQMYRVTNTPRDRSSSHPRRAF